MRLWEYERRWVQRRAAEPDAGLRAALAELADAPGCYLFSDSLGNVIYVGKAKSLRRRVRSYFAASAADDERTAELVGRIAGLELVVCASELDALLLEYRLIKLYKPWYNSQMKPDKQRPYLRLASGVPYPSLSAAALPADDGAQYFGFFTDFDDIGRTLSLLCRAFGLARCWRRDFSQPKSPCIYHDLEGCLSPCSGLADPDEYAARVATAAELLAGGAPARLAELADEMAEAAAALKFERAAALKELLAGLALLQRRSRRRFHLPDEGVVLVLIRPHRERAFSAFVVRDGRVVSRFDVAADAGEDGLESAAASIAAGEGGSSAQGSDAYTSDAPVYISTEDWLAGCLTEVSADKIFISLPESLAERVEVVRQALDEFAGGGAGGAG